MRNISFLLSECRQLHSVRKIWEGCAPSDAAFLGTCGATNLTIENGNARAAAGCFSIAGEFHYVKDQISGSAYGVYSTKTSKIEVAATLKDKYSDMFRPSIAEMRGLVGDFMRAKLFPNWTSPVGKSNDYFVFQDDRMIGACRAKCHNKECVDITIERENHEVLGRTRIMRPHNRSDLRVLISSSLYPVKFNVAKKETSFLSLVCVVFSLLLLLPWWCKPWKRRFPVIDMVLPPLLSRCSLKQDDITLLFAFSLLIRADWLKYKSEEDYGD